MRKLQNFKLYGYVSVLIVILVFLGINMLEAKKMPDKNVNWAVRLPGESYAQANNLNLYGMGNGYTYWGNNDSIAVIVMRGNNRQTRYYYIRLFIYYNTGTIWAGFRDVDINCDSDCQTGDGTSCGLPEPYDSLPSPTCVEGFLNDVQHPAEGYEHLMIMLYVYEDIEAMQPGQEIPLYGKSWGEFFVWNRFNCDDLDSDPPQLFYHTIIGKFGNPEFNEINGFFIKKNNENSWTISYRNSDVLIEEMYCEKELAGYTGKGKKAKPYYTEKNYTPLVGTSDFAFEFDLSKEIN